MTLSQHRGTAVLIAIACAFSLPAAASSQDVPFALTGHFQLRVDGALDDGARLYLTQRGAPRLLVLSESLGGPVVVAAGARKASSLAAGALGGESEAAQDDLLAVSEELLGASAGAAVDVRVSGGNVLFKWQGKQISLEPSEPLVGAQQPETLLAELPEYRRNATAYEPMIGSMRLLAQLEEPVQIDVFFGTWCPHCERVVPRLLKVLEGLDGTKFEVRLHGLPRKFTDEPMARQFGVKSVPTMIVRRGVEEVGRVHGDLFDQPEMALAATLFGD